VQIVGQFTARLLQRRVVIAEGQFLIACENLTAAGAKVPLAQDLYRLRRQLQWEGAGEPSDVPRLQVSLAALALLAAGYKSNSSATCCRLAQAVGSCKRFVLPQVWVT